MKHGTDLVIQYLLFGAKMEKQVEIQYEYLDKTKGDQRFGSIQPVKWLTGRKGTHILAWDTAANQYRRFALENIKRVFVTDIDWANKDLVCSISDIPALTCD